MKLSSHVENLKPSPTLSLNQKAKALKDSGKSVINLTTGEPDFPTPKHIGEAAIAAILKGETKYTATGGIPPLKKAIIERVSKQYGRSYKPSEVVVTVGAKQALFNLCLSLLNRGDEAIVLAPYWTSYPEMIEFAGGTPVVVSASDEKGFIPDVKEVARAVTEKTKILLLNSPSNPTGAVYPETVIRDLAALVRKHPNLTVVTDDIYDSLVFDNQKFFSVGMVSDLPKDQFVLIHGVSKTYAMTGWRIGFACGPEPLISAMEAVQSQCTSNPTTISQWAAIEALTGDQSTVETMRQAYQKRRDVLWSELQRIPDIRCTKPGGAFYFFINCSAFLGRKSPAGGILKDDVGLAADLLERKGLALVPGSVFGAPGFLRMTYSASQDDLNEGVRRFKEGLAELRF